MKAADLFKKILIPAIFWLLVWQGASMLVGSGLLLPGPWAVLRVLKELVITGQFWHTTLLTLLRIFAGLAIGIVLGSVIAVLTCASVWCDRLLSPAVKVVRAVPVASFILLVLLWVATGRVPMVISALMVLPVVWGNVSKGIRSADPGLLEVAKVYRFSPWKKARLIYLPAAAPYFAAGVETSLGLAWKAGVAAEVLCHPKLAVGTQVYLSYIGLETDDLFAWTLVVILLSFLVEKVLVNILRKAVSGYGAP